MQSFQYRTQFEKFNFYHQQYLDSQQEQLLIQKQAPLKKNGTKSRSYVNIQAYEGVYRQSLNQLIGPNVKVIQNKYFINQNKMNTELQIQNNNLFHEVILGFNKPISLSFAERNNQSVPPKQAMYDKTTLQKMNAFCADMQPKPQVIRLKDEVKKMFPQSIQRQKQLYLIQRLSSALHKGDYSQTKFTQDFIERRIDISRAARLMMPNHGNITEGDNPFILISGEQLKQDMQITLKSIHQPSLHQSPEKGDSPQQPQKKQMSSRKPTSYRFCEPRKVVDSPPKQKGYYELFREFLFNLNTSNNILVIAQETQYPTYKAIISKGNNGIVVRSCLKQRWWWTLVEKDTPLGEVNMIWNQNRKMEYYTHLQKACDLQDFTEDKSLGLIQNEDCKKEQRMRCDVRLQVQKGSLKTEHSKRVSSILMPIVEEHEFEKTLKIHKTLNMKSHNHLEKNFQITNKKALFYNISNFYKLQGKQPFDYIPLTIHVQKGAQDAEFLRFVEIFKQRELENDGNNVNLWILKPGENSNRGNGIEVSSNINEIRKLVSRREFQANGQPRTVIIQEYIQRPLLYNKRKFDIRCFMLMTATNNIIKGYWFQEGYIRTSSREFSVKNLENKMIHLTNDAIQKKGDEYGKYESGNKVSFNDFGKYIESLYKKIDFQRDIVLKLKSLARDVIGCGYELMDPHKRIHTFELFGLDFMIDENFKPWLIEVNNNPCLETSCSLLNRLIPSLVENVFRIALDPMYPPPTKIPKSKQRLFKENYFEQNRFELMFDSVGSSGLQLDMNIDDDEDVEGDE